MNQLCKRPTPQPSHRLFKWKEPKSPLEKIREAWINGEEISQIEKHNLETNRDFNPDIRVRETCRTLLLAINGTPENSVTAHQLLQKRGLQHLKALIRPSTP
jgi:hypothetical protein